MHASNPKAVMFDEDEIYRITRSRMARWLGIRPQDWDDLTYGDQCDQIEIRRAEAAIETMQRAKAQAKSRARPRRR